MREITQGDLFEFLIEYITPTQVNLAEKLKNCADKDSDYARKEIYQITPDISKARYGQKGGIRLDKLIPYPKSPDDFINKLYEDTFGKVSSRGRNDTRGKAIAFCEKYDFYFDGEESKDYQEFFTAMISCAMNNRKKLQEGVYEKKKGRATSPSSFSAPDQNTAQQDEILHDQNELKKRLKELLNDAKKNNNPMEVNVRELLSKLPEIKLCDCYNIAKHFNISIDWLLALSDVKKLPSSVPTYGDILKTLLSLEARKIIGLDYVSVSEARFVPNTLATFDLNSEEEKEICLRIKDKILQDLLSLWVNHQKDIDNIEWKKEVIDIFSDYQCIQWNDEIKEAYDDAIERGGLTVDRIAWILKTLKEIKEEEKYSDNEEE